MADDKKQDGAIEEIVKDLMEDPDAPEKGDTVPPQTINAEPSRDAKR